MKKYYKFRSLQNLGYFFDIIRYNRLYTAKYTELNDPIEGIFRTNANEGTIQLLINGKDNTRICSLSKDYKHTLLWSHYADGHKGCCIEVSMENDNEDIAPVIYSKDITDANEETDLKRILRSKSPAWEYEQEVRALLKETPGSPESKYLKVKIHKIRLGSEVSDDDFQFYQKLIRKINPKIKVSKMTRDEIYTGFNK